MMENYNGDTGLLLVGFGILEFVFGNEGGLWGWLETNGAALLLGDFLFVTGLKVNGELRLGSWGTGLRGGLTLEFLKLQNIIFYPYCLLTLKIDRY